MTFTNALGGIVHHSFHSQFQNDVLTKMVMPLIMGGNTWRTARGGMKDMAMVVKQAAMMTPIKRPCKHTLVPHSP